MTLAGAVAGDATAAGVADFGRAAPAAASSPTPPPTVQQVDALAVARSLVRAPMLLATARVVWLSTVRPDGRPHVVPVWFDWDGEAITVFTRPDAQKARNVSHEPRVMVAIGTPDPPFDVELLEAEAAVLPVAPDAPATMRFLAKYAAELEAMGRSDAWFTAAFPTALRIRPTRLLDWAMRAA